MWILTKDKGLFNSTLIRNIELYDNDVVAQYLGSYHITLGSYGSPEEANTAVIGVAKALEDGRPVFRMPGTE